jgi:hypothetical protein
MSALQRFWYRWSGQQEADVRKRGVYSSYERKRSDDLYAAGSVVFAVLLIAAALALVYGLVKFARWAWEH